jgi:hypothetical protein
MTRKVFCLWIAMTSLLMSHGTLAGESYSNIDQSMWERVPVALAAKVKNPQALETFYGDIIDVSKIRVRSQSNVAELLRGHQIELRDGQIFYPEEIEFLLSRRGTNEKAPHTPD